jgi:enterochelin esterase family protein
MSRVDRWWIAEVLRRHTGVLILAGAGVLALGVCSWPHVVAQGRPEPAPGTTTLEAAIADIEAGRKTTPLIGEPTDGGEATVTFLVKRVGHAPRIVSDVTGWGEHPDGTFDFNVGRMTRVGRTDWYALQAKVAPRARIEYLIVYGPADYRLDPHNPRQAAGPQLGGARASEFVMPGYVPPQEFAAPPVSSAGLITEATIESKVLRGPCRLTVYTPSGYGGDRDHPMAIFLDSRSDHVSRVLDSLITQEAIEPIVAVFVAPHVAVAGTGAPMRTFLTGELLTWLSSRYAVARSADKRAIIGISYGAKDALDAALASRDAFARLGLSIPGRRIGRGDIDAIAERISHRLRVAILAAQYDRANVATARDVRQALAEAGHLVDYREVPEGHSAVTWIHHLRFVLVSLFSPPRPRVFGAACPSAPSAIARGAACRPTHRRPLRRDPAYFAA